ncbi:MAG: TolC family protein [Cytophagales bacterium]|uniref:TolC family protein n=1 Tax=Cyclobacterium marinum TaxID=104 RepID=UPI0030DBBEA2|nr:TolC family protein [Cytophagales bacterium]|tara:strand:- start:3005 stop:4351 length:1347 start_codon:yes stop_codon:yes gene_type:complete
MALKLKAFLLLLSFFTLKVQAQSSWSLEECVAYAMVHNLEVKDFEYVSQSGKENYRQSIRNLLPRIDASTGYNINYGRSTDPFTNDVVTNEFFSNGYSLSSSIDLFQGFLKMNSIKTSRFIYEANLQETLQQKYLLAFRVMRAFYDVRFYEELVEVAKGQTEVSQANYNLVKRQIELGLKAGADLYESESLLLSDKLNLTQSENKLELAKLQLMQEMNLEDRDNFYVARKKQEDGFQQVFQAIHTDSIYQQAENFLPLLKAQEFRINAARKQIDVNRAYLYPSLSLYANIGTGYFQTTRDTLGNTIEFRNQIRDNTYRAVGLSLNIPISRGWSTRSRIKQSKIDLLRVENNFEIQKQTVYNDIQQLVVENKALQNEYAQSLQKVKAQELTFLIAQRRYEKGLISILELTSAKNLFSAAQNENLEVGLRLEVNNSTIDFYRGVSLFNIQ